MSPVPNFDYAFFHKFVFPEKNRKRPKNIAHVVFYYGIVVAF